MIKKNALKKVFVAIGICLFIWETGRATDSDWWTINPKVKWLYLSSGIYLDRWGGSGANGNGLSWKPKNRSLNPPQTLTSISAGGSMALTRNVGLSLSMPFFYNTFDEYTDHAAASRSGLGDFEIGIPIKRGKVNLQPTISIPGPYEAKYLNPWTGFGVYRGGMGLSYSFQAHSAWALGEMVLYKPGGKDRGLVEEGDFALKAGYGQKLKLHSKLKAKAGLDLAYNSFRWHALAKAQTYFSADPKVSISFILEREQDLSFTTSATLYSYQGGEPDFRSYASRRIFFGIYYGIYF